MIIMKELQNKKNNLSNIIKNNIDNINKLQKMIKIIDEIDENLLIHIQNYLNEINILEKKNQENIELFKIICKNLI